METFFSEAKFFFNAKYQREFTQVTSEASFLSKFKLILALLKDFAKLKKVHFESLFHTTCSFVQHFFALWNLFSLLQLFFSLLQIFFCLLLFPLLRKKKLQYLKQCSSYPHYSEVDASRTRSMLCHLTWNWH